MGICTNEEGELVVDSNSEEVQQATIRPTYGAAAVQHLPPPPPGKAESFNNGQTLCPCDCFVALFQTCTALLCWDRMPATVDTQTTVISRE